MTVALWTLAVRPSRQETPQRRRKAQVVHISRVKRAGRCRGAADHSDRAALEQSVFMKSLSIKGEVERAEQILVSVGARPKGK